MSDLSKRLKQKLAESLANRTWKLRPEVLVGPNTPKPLHGVVPREILGASWWNKTRKAAFASTDNHCIACGVHKLAAKSRQWLEGHEVYDIDYLLGRATYVETVGLCHFCHNYIHDGRLKSLLDQGKIHHQKYTAIIQHGDALLAANRLERTRYEGPSAEWADWRLVIDGVEYPPRYQTFESWMDFYA